MHMNRENSSLSLFRNTLFNYNKQRERREPIPSVFFPREFSRFTTNRADCCGKWPVDRLDVVHHLTFPSLIHPCVTIVEMETRGEMAFLINAEIVCSSS